MPNQCFPRLFVCFSLLLLATPGNLLAQVEAPVLKWQHGGCYSSWCETGWYSSPAVADLDNDGDMEVVAATYSVFILNGEDGELIKSIDPPGGRVWPDVVLADLDADGDLEIVTAHGSGYLNVFDHTGNILWSKNPVTNELRGLSVSDLDNDSTLEIIVTGAVTSKTNTWVYEHDGTLRTGWPQLSNDLGYAYGTFNDTAAVGDINGDGESEVIVPSDVHYICAYYPDGSPIWADPIYGDKAWGKVGVWESLIPELRGWGSCDGDRVESYRANFAHGAGAIADMNRDGQPEIIVTGNVYDCSTASYESRYTGLYIFDADRSRFKDSIFNWEAAPVDTGAPLVEDYNVIESAIPNPAIADLDGDGQPETLFPSYDGRLHAFWLDKTEHGNWPYSVYNPASGVFRFASEPVIADLDNNGTAEVIFTSWVQKGSALTGKLHILDYQGNPLYEPNLPGPFGSADWNGSLAAPTIANIDSDDDFEIVINTAHSGVVAFDLPGSSLARILWGTGRGSYHRNGVPYHDLSLCPADISGDGQVASADLAIFAAAFGRANCSGAACPADIDTDTDVDAVDLSRIAAGLGQRNCL
ncbi:MAG: VCBS repeat-containing protein [Desulfobulbaceae bacterium]|nr:VCBS repeat-containing protein [Desulfobulbaceae bacterium]